jgi:phosphatidylinositol glycan class B
LKHLTLFEKRLLFIALIAHLIAAWFSVGFHHPDEHFQLIEFANYKLGRTPLNKLPWEFPAEMRPGLQPLMVYLLLKPYLQLGFEDPYRFVFLLRLISGLLALFTAWKFHKAIEPQIKSLFLKKLHLFLSILGWGLVYLHVRFSSENWSAITFAWAVILLWKGGGSKYWWFGLLAGLSFVFRFQAIFMIGGAGLWMIFSDKTPLKNIVQVIGAFIMAFGVGLLCEYWLYGHFTVSSWAYVEQNVFQNKAAHFGTEPWYWYFVEIFKQGIAPYSIILLLSIPVMVIYKPRHILTWSMIVFLLGHIVVAHKEFRFLFPLAFFFPFYAVTTLSYLEEKLQRFDAEKWYRTGKKIFLYSFIIVNAVEMILLITKPSHHIIQVNEVLYRNLKRETVILYSYEFNPYSNADTLGATFYANPLISSYCIDDFMNDTMALKGKDVWIFSEHAYPKDEFIFQYAGPFFDSSRTTVLWRRLPAWTYKYNFNNWLERSNAYTLYQLHEKPVR